MKWGANITNRGKDAVSVTFQRQQVTNQRTCQTIFSGLYNGIHKCSRGISRISLEKGSLLAVGFDQHVTTSK